MRIERVQPQELQLSLHPLEMAALVTAARWVVTGQTGEPPAMAVQQLSRMLASYERQTAAMPS